MSFEFRVSSFELCHGPRRMGRELVECHALRPTRNPKPETRSSTPGFTLIEIMVVVAIMAIVLTIGIPFMNTSLNGGKGMNRAVKDVQEACKVAREWAILRQSPQELRIRVDDGTYFEVSPARLTGDGWNGELSRRERYLRSLAEGQDRGFSPNVEGNEWRMQNRPSSGGQGGGNFSVKLPDGVGIEAILANGLDVTETGSATVVFRPNGTCDELNLVLFRPESNERRQIWLEIVTGYTDIESDPSKFRDHNQ
jgi:prepilin-type N-terminal cleavage/methylation domain-containing protein